MLFRIRVKNDHMIDRLMKNSGKKTKLLIPLAVIMALFPGYASPNAADRVPTGTEPKSHLAGMDQPEYEVIICFGDSLTFGTGARVIIGGLKFPAEDRGFGEGYEELAAQTGSILIPNIFANIRENRKLMSDPIHPNNAGYTIIARRFYKAMLIRVKD